jgi:hypothetical protein
MKLNNLYALLFAFLLFSSASAQYSKPAPQSKPAQQKTLSEATDSLKMAANDIKTSFNSIFTNKRDTVAIMISNVEYDDAHVTTLKENLKKLKGVKNVLMQYKAETAILEISYKGKSSELWDKLPGDVKEPFKLIEADDNSIKLKVR